MALFSNSIVPAPVNERMRNYEPGSEDAVKLKAACDHLRSAPPAEIPCVVGGTELRSGDIRAQRMPGDHRRVLCTFHQANKEIVTQAIQSALAAKEQWEEMPFEHRAAIFLKAADLISHKYRYELLAATILGQGKNVWQAEVDAAAEVVDFLRFNVKYAEEIYSQQPPTNSPTVWNRCEYRPLEGYVVAISPFNFTALGTNLCTSVALMGNVVLWKPASTAILSNWVFYRILREAGLPDGVIQFIPGSGATIGELVFQHRSFVGCHFTGSTAVFNDILFKTAQNLKAGLYQAYPRIVGETGGKDFHFVHTSADIPSVTFSTIRAAFEYQGQKCSACSRVYVPESLWPAMKKLFVEHLPDAPMGQSDDFSSFMSAVIDKASFTSIKKYIDEGKADPQCELVVGGQCDDSTGYFIRPTVFRVSDPKHKLMQEEIFGPVLTVYVYADADYEATLKICNDTSPYALTGSIFARDRAAIMKAQKMLRHAAGNFYINDKCTGAVVGQQPFGGARMSGTNDKAGASLNLLRWVSVRTIKENFLPLSDYRYPHMQAK